MSELKNQTSYITFFDFSKIIINWKKEENKDDGILDAFYAMGGDKDGSGCVDANKLIDVIRNDFNLTIDIEGMISEIDTDGNGEIELNEFETLLKSEGNNPEIDNFKDFFSF